MSPSLKHTRALVVGLAKSGVAAARLLAREGARVTAADRRTASELGPVAEELARLGASLALGPHDPGIFTSAELIVVSPGVPMGIAPLQAAMAAGVQVVAEVELASWFLSGALIGVTGTNGKSTVTSLTGCLCQTAGLRTFAGGNLGRPLSEAALSGEDCEAIVCELSSFQLEGIGSLHPRSACVTNLTPDHVDRYPDMGAYAAAKRRIFTNQTACDAAVVNASDPETLKMAQGAESRLYTFGFGERAERGARWDGRAMLVCVEGSRERYEVRNRALRGAHNLENAMASVLLARTAGVPAEKIQAGLDAYPGLAHRIESAGAVGGVEYINDSKATNVDSTLVALKAFERGVWLIAGGRGKGAPYAPMVELSKGRVKGVLTLGEDAAKIGEAYRGTVEVIDCGDLAGAVGEARRRAVPGDVVLLSPACASYDQFENFEERGECFKAMVRALPGFSAVKGD